MATLDQDTAIKAAAALEAAPVQEPIDTVSVGLARIEREVTPAVPPDSSTLPIDVRKFSPQLPPVNVLPRTFHDEAGYNLTRWVLMGLFAAIMTVMLFSAFLPPSYHGEAARAAAAKIIMDCVSADVSACPPAKLE